MDISKSVFQDSTQSPPPSAELLIPAPPQFLSTIGSPFRVSFGFTLHSASLPLSPTEPMGISSPMTLVLIFIRSAAVTHVIILIDKTRRLRL
ncbi:hypothetical protein BDN70DRAFT_887360 [Pholiota conissans]|uniref:Uncharacterized protein n=1 Tax=Pholiota conissans TaxID=109636 RepID=A0A9P5YMP3_9AGAR|nr:hypothetical protein BDN70DRAFT_887360 [Pholiota conissans]